MKYHLDTEYAWYDTPEGSKVVLMYFIQNVPFTFDELPEIARNLPEVEQTANQNEGGLQIICTERVCISCMKNVIL